MSTSATSTKPTPAAAKAATTAAKPAAAAAAKPAAAAAKPAATTAVAAKPTAAAAVKPVVAAAAKVAAAVKPPVVAAPPAEAAEAADAVDVVDADAAADADGEEEGSKRQHMNEVLGLDISHARCSNHLKANLSDPVNDEQIKDLRKQMKAAKDKNDDATVEALKKDIAERQKNNVRISADTPIAAAKLADMLVKELLCAGMSQAIACERKVVKPDDYHQGDVSGIGLFPIVEKLPAFAGFNPEREAELVKERAAANKAAKEAREAKKAAEDKKAAPAKAGKAAAPAAKPAPKAAAKAEPKGDDDDGPAENGDAHHADGPRSSFNTYVECALQTVKADPAFSSMRVSNRVREDLSDITAELMTRLSKLARTLVDRVAGARTMNADHIKAVIELLMIDGNRSPEQIKEVVDAIDEVVARYHALVKDTKEKKLAGLDDDKKAAMELKRHELELARKQKAIESAKKRAVEAATRSKTLEVEVKNLAPLVAKEQAEAAARAAEQPEAEPVVTE